MFRRFASFVGVDNLFRLHPYDLVALLELAWDRRVSANFELGHPLNRSDLDGLGGTWLGHSTFASNPPNPITGAIAVGLGRGSENNSISWEHLIYAYMVNNTRAPEIFRRVVHEFRHGERLGVPSTQTPPGLTSDSQKWLRNTEELFFREGAPFFVSTLTSHVQTDMNTIGRRAYWTLFGMDLNHGTDDNKPYPYVKPEAANTLFVATFEEFLREVWIGFENVNNSSGINPTDDAKIFDLVLKLRDMLRARREGGNLSREEFALVCMMSWFHLTLLNDTAIVQDLRAQSASPEQRLFAIAQRVGLAAHGLTRTYLSIADAISFILLLIELDFITSPAQVAVFYTLPASPAQQMATIIRDWSVLSGREMKARKVAAA